MGEWEAVGEGGSMRDTRRETEIGRGRRRSGGRGVAENTRESPGPPGRTRRRGGGRGSVLVSEYLCTRL